MPQGIGNLFTGFTQGFANSYFQGRQRKHEEDMQHEQNQMKVMQYAMSEASQRGDTNAIAHILRSMEEFQNVGTGTKAGRGKGGAQARQGLMSKFADMMESGREVQGTQGDPQQVSINLDEGKPPVQEEAPGPPPSPTFRKPLLMSTEEIARRDIGLEEEKQRRLLPIKTKEADILIKSRAEEARITEAQKATARMDAIKLQNEGRTNLDAGKLAHAYILQGIAPELANQMAGQDITDLQQAKTAELKDRVLSRQRNFDQHQEALTSLENHRKELEKNARAASLRGDKALALRIQKQTTGEGALGKSMNTAMGQLRGIQSEINSLERIVSNPLSADDPRIQEWRNNLSNLTQQWLEKNKEIDGYKDDMRKIGIDLEKRRLRSAEPGEAPGGAAPSGPPSKRLVSPGKKSDPLGILP